MDNQHRQIKGYRELSQQEIDAMNEIKAKGAELGALVAKLRAMPPTPAGGLVEGQVSVDQRWVAIGATHMQEGLMALTRAVAQPSFF